MSPLATVVARLHSLGRRRTLAVALRGATGPMAAAAGLAVTGLLLDWWLHLPVAVRAIHLAASVAFVGVLCWRQLVKPLSRRPGLEQLALLAEASDPRLGDQLISALQLERDLNAGVAVESPELIHALVADSAQRFSTETFRNAAPLAPAFGALCLGLLACCVPAGIAAADSEIASIWLQRSLLLREVPWPRMHYLVVEISDAAEMSREMQGDNFVFHVAERTPLQVNVSAEPGTKLPDSVNMLVTPIGDTSDAREIPLGRSPSGAFQHIFPPLMASFSFSVSGGDDDDGLPLYEIRVARAPRVTAFSAHYEYPSYTGMQPRDLPDANISAPEGTRITLHFTVNMGLTAFRLNFEKAGAAEPTLQPDGTWNHTFTVSASDVWSWKLQGENGVASTAVPRYVVTCENDQPPHLALELPGSTTLLVTPQAVIPFKGVASDDFGVTELGLRYGTDPKVLGLSVPFNATDLATPLGGRTVPFFRAQPVAALRLAAESATEAMPSRPERAPGDGERFAMRLAVADNRVTATQPEPHRILSEQEFRVQVISPQELQKEFSQRQVRLRDRAADITTLLDQRIAETSDLIAVLRASSDQPPGEPRFVALEQGVVRIQGELGSLSRQFQRIADGYLWNRLDHGFLTEKLMEVLGAGFLAHPEQESSAAWAQALKDVRPAIDEATLMGRVAAILQLALNTALELAPAATKQFAVVNATPMPARLAPLETVLPLLQKLRDGVAALTERLESWENYLDVIQGFRELLDLEKGVEHKLRKVTNK
ncbi:MAG: hypothetical protein EXS14_02180 [Planctomycetes bacterium]|nr:hypothetical protein [Planctomycetota bacterium]